MRLSAIVPTHDRPEPLRNCLQTLQRQQIDPVQLEVIVVDDGSTCDVPAVVGEVGQAGRVPMRCERQPLSGLNAARNRGASLAEGELLAFLDDDTLVAPGWAAAIVAAFAEHDCAAVGGKVELGLDGEPPPWLAPRRDYLAEYDLGDEPRWLERDQWSEGDPLPVGANCAVRRAEFERLAGFHVGLDRMGRSLISNGDTEFFRRLRASGARLWYEPRAAVIHCVPAGRLTLGFFTRRHYAQGVSDELLYALDGGRPSWHRRYRHARELLHAAKILAADVRGGRGTVNARFWASYWAGRLMAVGKRPPAPQVVSSARSAIR